VQTCLFACLCVCIYVYQNEKAILVTKVNYEVIIRKAKLIIKQFLAHDKHFNGNICIIGGVTINAPEEDYFVLYDVFYYIHGVKSVC